jgi:septal ring factor EnvC (AmiA/AmiB activator)
VELSNIIILANLVGLLVLAFWVWSQIRAAKQQVLEIVNRDLAEVRRQMRLTLAHANRQYDQIGENHEKILMLEVNMASAQDELEKVSRKVEKYIETNAFG